MYGRAFRLDDDGDPGGEGVGEMPNKGRVVGNDTVHANDTLTCLTQD